MSPAKVLGNLEDETTSDAANDETEHKRNLSISVMLSKPILALEFNCLKMKVEAPTVLLQQKQILDD